MPNRKRVFIVHAVGVLSCEDAKEEYLRLKSESGCRFPSNSTTGKILYHLFEKNRSDGPGDVQFVPSADWMGGEPPGIVYDSLSEYYFLRSLLRLGHYYFEVEDYKESYECFQPAADYYARTKGHTSQITRETKMRLTRTLLHWGQYEAIVVEMADDAQHYVHSNATQAYVTMYLKYAYGLSLVRLGRTYEAPNFLAQQYFGHMLWMEPMRVIFKYTLSLVLEIMSQGYVQFCMEMYILLMAKMCPSFGRQKCPLIYIEFCGNFAQQLALAGHDDQLDIVYAVTAELLSEYHTLQSSMVKAVVSCSLPKESAAHKSGVKFIVETQENAQKVTSPEKFVEMTILQTTTRWVYIWCEEAQALRIITDTLKKFQTVLKPNHSFLNYCHLAIADILASKD